ncbi:MAG TPA: nucleotidyltransferase domain-containing protein [Longimicrobium sp.]|nr:nucleotidyltransferase domain-containing protein [Longimicrobium sp.]
MKKDRRPAAKSSLASLFPSMAMARLVVFFAVHPGCRYHVRELSRITRLSSASLQHELRRLMEMGSLRREDTTTRAYYRADETHPSWRAWMLLLRSSARPADVLREALVDAPGLEAAFVFGSSARGDARADSDVDVFLVGTEEARAAAGRRLSDAELLLGRALDVIGYDPKDLAARIRSGNPLIRRVLSEPCEWICGDFKLVGITEAA